jgi:hypothetical protein
MQIPRRVLTPYLDKPTLTDDVLGPPGREPLSPRARERSERRRAGQPSRPSPVRRSSAFMQVNASTLAFVWSQNGSHMVTIDASSSASTTRVIARWPLCA